MNGLLEYKYFTAEIKDIDTIGRRVTGYWASYGNKDYDNDIIEEGAAAKSIMERGPNGSNEIFFLNQHNWSQPHGKPSLLISDTKGIYFESGKMPNTTYSNDSLELYAAGIVIQHSIGFQTIKADSKGNWSEGNYTRRIKELKLFEGSNVTLGANPETPFTGFKSLNPKQIEDQIKAICKLFRNGTLTDETFGILEIALKQLQLHSFELGKQSLENSEPDNSTHDNKEPINQSEIINNFTKSLLLS
ncbi:Caudovirus prohead protease [compost metagenome]